MEVNVFNIQHYSTGDGPGIRTTVFLGGCNLKCPWCHNPEALWGGKSIRETDDIVKQVRSDKAFYDKSGGGVTLSGGEPLLQFDGCFELLKSFKEHRIHTIIDTALSVGDLDFERITPLCDCFLADIKTADARLFESVCGGRMETVTNNLAKLLELGAEVVLRIPLIPGFNMDEKSIDGIIGLIKPLGLPATLLPFHRLGSYKYKKLGIEYRYAETLPPDEETIIRIREKFNSNNIKEANL